METDDVIDYLNPYTFGNDFEDKIGIKLCVIGCVGALALIITGVISEKNALKSIDLKTIFLFGGTLSLAAALQETGAGEEIATAVIGILGKIHHHTFSHS